MGATEFGVNHGLTVKRWSTSLAVEAEVRQYFRKFMGAGDTAMIKIKTELVKGRGDSIRFALSMKLTEDGVEGENAIEGTSAEESLDFFYDTLLIDQRRKGTKTKGKMTQQRVPYDLRKKGRDSLAVWWAEDYDQMLFCYLSGARGIATNFHVPVGWTGRAGNPLQAPDSSHVIYAGGASGLSDIDSNDKMSLDIVERLTAAAETTDPMIQPFDIEGEAKHVLLMHTWQAYDLRRSISVNDWMDVHKATDGQKSIIYKNSLGEYGGVILHKHRNVIRFDDSTGCASGVTAARSLFLGAQAAMIAWGGANGPGRYDWHEETDDRGQALAITSGTIYGVKKTRFNDMDFSVFAVDAYCKNPNN